MVLQKLELKIRTRNGDKIKNYSKWGLKVLRWAWLIRWGLLVNIKANWSQDSKWDNKTCRQIPKENQWLKSQTNTKK